MKLTIKKKIKFALWLVKAFEQMDKKTVYQMINEYKLFYDEYKLFYTDTKDDGDTITFFDYLYSSYEFWKDGDPTIAFEKIK